MQVTEPPRNPGRFNRILAEGMREAYADLFELNTLANTMTRDEVKNKLKTLTQGQFSDDVLGKMAGTFVALAAKADFKAVESAKPPAEDAAEVAPDTPPALVTDGRASSRVRPPIDLVYNIELVLPESRDPAVYDALFRSLRAHLLND
ncbi:DUF5343 domain-containing protein [Nocardioides sp. JQ2195]|uniref:DUF5343 domain-containing protein n=1 Tax=Nocardioides sp. JQ2195 TaxID=2592334 RepID=UPI0023FA2B10|nr:DUF5343 domain-containing protein [Nocardioides sp. JQ2195]